MSEEIDRRIAEEVMGERRPQDPPGNIYWRSDGGNWKGAWTDGEHHRTRYSWVPLPFSSDLELATKAVDKNGGDSASLVAIYSRDEEEAWSVSILGFARDGATLPEAICNLLLALVEKR